MNEPLTWDDVQARLQAACDAFERYDSDLLHSQANERSLTHRFACYLQTQFPEWHVDCEYNRRETDIKRLRRLFPDAIAADDTEARTVYPDIIVHRRGEPRNLLVIEAKKNTFQDETDRAKLFDFLNDEYYAYIFAVQLLFDTNSHSVHFQRYSEDSAPNEGSQP